MPTDYTNSQMAAFGSMTSIMTQGAEQARTLSMAAAKAWGEHCAAAATQWAAVKDSQAFWALAAASAKSNADWISAQVDDFARNSPAGTEILVALMKAAVANSRSGYLQINKFAGASEAPLAKTSKAG
jgi:phasin protein